MKTKQKYGIWGNQNINGLKICRKYQNYVENRAQSLYFYHSKRYATITGREKFQQSCSCQEVIVTLIHRQMKTLSCQFYLNVRINLALSCYMSYLFMAYIAMKGKKSMSDKKNTPSIL